MPATNISRMFSGHFYTLLNVAIMFLTFFESYIYPFAIVKWIVVITKYGCLPYVENCHIDKKTKTRYQYNLRLVTSSTQKQNEEDIMQECESNVSVIMEEFEGPIWFQLSYCGQDCNKIPPALLNMYGPKVKNLDLSYNSIETLKGLEQFISLEELVLDNNNLGDLINFPYLPYLRTLSLNNNQISDLENFIDKVADQMPALTYLSLLCNKACPNELSDHDKDESDYQRYRYYVLYKLKNLRFLDSRRVSASERSEAEKRGEFMRVRRPRDDVTDSRENNTPQAVRALPVDFSALGKHKGAYGKCHYKYTGKHSEGNRFIVNSDL